MNILACSDLHGDFTCLYDIEIHRKHKIEAVFCAGDVTNYGLHSPRAQAEFYLAVEHLALPFYWVPGNHDIGMHSDLLRTPTKFNHYAVLGASLSPCFLYPELATKWHNMTAYPVRDTVYYETLPPCDILVSHCPPTGDTGYDLDTKQQLGSPGLLSYIEEHQPKLVICGHIHSPRAREVMLGKTRVVNVACEPKVITL